MSDKRMRELERAASSGDVDAVEALNGYRTQAYGVRSIFHCCEIGEWIHIEGPNFSDVGIVREIYMDELQRAVCVIDKVKRRQNETDANGPSWLVSLGDGLHIPSTSCNGAQRATDRWAGFEAW